MSTEFILINLEIFEDLRSYKILCQLNVVEKQILSCYVNIYTSGLQLCLKRWFIEKVNNALCKNSCLSKKEFK